MARKRKVREIPAQVDTDPARVAFTKDRLDYKYVQEVLKDNPAVYLKLDGKPAPPVTSPDPIDHPPHYTAGSIESITYIEDREGWALGFCLGNASKYLHRAGLKTGVDVLTDLRKSRWYLDRYIQFVEKKELQKQEQEKLESELKSATEMYHEWEEAARSTAQFIEQLKWKASRARSRKARGRPPKKRRRVRA